MKRIGNIMQQVISPDNLRLAFWKAQRGKSNREEILSFSRNLDENLTVIREQLLNDSFFFGNYRYFTIYEPKDRNICAASFPERIVHHALMNICHDGFERFQLYESFACRKNKGTFAALNRAALFNGKYEWYLKLDVRKYFDNINHIVLKSQLNHLFKDTRLLDNLERIIDSYSVSTNTGLPIGNLTSQYFANYYLAYADHYAKEQLQIPAYVRYMDDMVLWDNDRRRLQNTGNIFNTYIKNVLQLELKPFILNHCAHGLPFLGFILNSGIIRLNRSSKQRFVSKLKVYITQLENGTLDERSFSQGVLALYGFISHGRYKGFATNVLSKIKDDSLRLEPCVSRRQLEQQCAELPRVIPQQQQSQQPQQQPWFSGRPLAQYKESGCFPIMEQAADSYPENSG